MNEYNTLNVKFSNSQLNLINKISGPLLITGLPLIGNVLKPLAKSALIPLWLPAAAKDAAIHKKYLYLVLQH